MSKQTKSARARKPRTASGKSKVSPLISVIVPVYNVADYLEQCLDSLVSQDDVNFEVVIVDDGSRDNSPAIIAEYCQRHENFRAFRQANSGLGSARNSGFALSKGEFVTFLDSDDWVSPVFVSALREAQKAGDYDIVGTKFERVNEAGKSIKPSPVQTHHIPDELHYLTLYQRLLGGFTPSVAWGRLYRRKLIEEHQLRFPERIPHEDLFFTYKAYMFSGSETLIDETLVSWRIRDGSLSRSIREEHVDAAVMLWDQTEAFLEANDRPSLDAALAARRNLIFIRDIWNKAGRTEDPTPKARILHQFARRVQKIEEMISLFEGSALAGTFDSNSLKPALDALRNQQSLEGRATAPRPASTIPTPDLTWPHANVNLQHYSKKEYEGDPTADDEAMAKLYNRFKGERCFIIGNGPSLNKHDLALLEGEYTFAVNSIYYKTDEMGFVPTFFVVEDSKVMEENLERIIAYDAPYKFFPSKYRQMVGEDERTTFYRSNWGFYQKSSANYCVPRFSVDASREVFAGQTVTYANLQLAFFMGFTEVYLIGMDFDYVIPKEHVRSGNHILSTTDDPNHFHKDYFGKGKTWKDPKLERVAMSYRQAKVTFEAAGRRVFNATIGGSLEIFPRVDYEALLRDPKSKRKRGERLSPVEMSSGEGDAQRFEPHLAPANTKTVEGVASGTTVVAPNVRAAARTNSAKWAKLRRDPHLFFRDSKVGILRPLRHLFRPTGVSKWQAELDAKLKRQAGGVWAFLPVSRRASASYRAELRNEGLRLESSLRSDIASLRRELNGQKTQLVRLSEESKAGFAAHSKVESDVAALQDDLIELNERLTRQAAETATELRVRFDEQVDALTAQIDANYADRSTVEAELAALRKAEAEQIDEIREVQDHASQALKDELSALGASLAAEKRTCGPANAQSWRVHDRFLSSADISRIQKDWLKPLGLFLTPRQLGYMAHHICLAEEGCEGRMATTIQAAMLRSLALLSLQSKDINLLEIGTLFGVGSGTLYQAGARDQKRVKLTLIDPLDGYYGQQLQDESTGVPVTREVLERNMTMLGIPSGDYRVIQRLSTDDEAVKAASDRQYDYLLIDGDHSLEGVAADFELYGPMVKPGGVVVFDDYATTDWPAIQTFVDEQVRGLDDWLWIGGEWRTGIFRKKRSADSRKKAEKFRVTAGK